MQSLNKQDLIWIVRRMPSQVFDLLKAHKTLFVAGGYIRSVIANEPIADIDLFAPSKDAARFAAEAIVHIGKVHETENAFSVKLLGGMQVQFIHRWTFDTPEACIASFDFTIACAAVWNDDGWKSLADDDFYADLAAKRLVYRKPVRNEDAGGSMLRVLKFYQRGYRIPLDSLGAVIARLMKGVGADEVASRVARLGSTVEHETAFVVTGLLRQVDPLIDPSGLAHLPSSQEPVEEPQEAKEQQ